MVDPVRHIKMHVVREPAAGTPEVITPRMGVALTRKAHPLAVAYDCGGCVETVFMDESDGFGHDRFTYHCSNCGAYNQLTPPAQQDPLAPEQA
jgi:hypothetical protein